MSKCTSNSKRARAAQDLRERYGTAYGLLDLTTGEVETRYRFAPKHWQAELAIKALGQRPSHHKERP